MTISPEDAAWYADLRRRSPESYPEGALFDERHALMTRAQFEALPDYSCSIPTGAIPGKCWKRRKDYHDPRRPVPVDGWMVGRYDPHPTDDSKVTPYLRAVLLID